MDRPVYSPKQAARRAAVSPSLVYAWLHAGRLPGYRLGARGRGKWLIRAADLDSFLDTCRAAAGLPPSHLDGGPPMNTLAIEERLGRIEAALAVLVERQQVREWYGVEEFARSVGRAEFTVREWCRLSRVRASKRQSGRGRAFEWVIAHDELLRFRRDGLLPLR